MTWFWTSRALDHQPGWNVQFLYALRRDVVLDVRRWVGFHPLGQRRFYTPFGVTWFWTAGSIPWLGGVLQGFLYALRRDVVLDDSATRAGLQEARFYTPFGVTWFWTALMRALGGRTPVSIRPSA